MRQNIEGNENFIYDTAGIASTINALTGAFTDSRGTARIPLPYSVNADSTLRTWTTDGPRWPVSNIPAGARSTSCVRSSDNPANPVDLTETGLAQHVVSASLGAEYRPDDRWTLRGGAAFDEKAVPNANLEPRIPDANRRLDFRHIGYHWNENTDIDLACDHIFTPYSSPSLNPAEPGNALRGSLEGVTQTDANLVGLQIVFKD